MAGPKNTDRPAAGRHDRTRQDKTEPVLNYKIEPVFSQTEPVLNYKIEPVFSQTAPVFSQTAPVYFHTYGTRTWVNVKSVMSVSLMPIITSSKSFWSIGGWVRVRG